jgi:rhamnosyltransferase
MESSSEAGSSGRVPRRVLVLLTAHNGMRWIQEQVESILAQEGVEVTLLVSDDASTDGTFELLASMAGVSLLPERGPYGGAGKNFFHLLSRADYSRCDFVALADQDDIWYPWKLARAVSCLEERQCDGYGANVTAFWEDGREADIHKAHAQRDWDFLFEAAGPGCTYVFSVRLARQIQEALRAQPGIPEEVSQHDWLVYAWARSKGFSWYIDPRPVMRYRQHSTNDFGVNTGSRAARRRIERMRSGWYRKQVEAIARTCGVDSHPFVRTVLSRTWKGRLTLALEAGKCRRRHRDAAVLSAASLMGWF